MAHRCRAGAKSGNQGRSDQQRERRPVVLARRVLPESAESLDKYRAGRAHLGQSRHSKTLASSATEGINLPASLA